MAVRLTHEPGELIGHYMVESLLGRGAHGSVYRCVDPQSGAKRIIKEMHLAAPEDEAAVALRYFQAEGELLARLAHPNLPTGQPLTVPGPFAVDPATGGLAGPDCAEPCSVAQRHYLVMEAIDGSTLEELCQSARANEHPLSPSAVWAWTKQIGAALTYLHDQGLVHRDVKPANIVISANQGQAMLIDLGLTRPCRVVPGYGTLPIGTSGRFGTRGYAPPDPMEQEEPTPLSDLYALALTVMRALTGLDPTQPAELERLLEANLLEVRSDIEPYQAVLLRRSLRAEPGDRPSSVAAFIEGLSHPPAPGWSCWIELHPPAIEVGQVRPGQVRDLTITIHDKRSGKQPEGEAISEDPSLRILPPALRGHDILLPLVLRVPGSREPGHYRTALTVRTADEEHEVPVTYEVVPRVGRSGPMGCLLLGLGSTR